MRRKLQEINIYFIGSMYMYFYLLPYSIICINEIDALS